MEPETIQAAQAIHTIAIAAMDWKLFFTVIGTGFAATGFIYNVLRNFKADVNKNFERYDKKFDAFERRMEMMDQRMFLLCMGKTLPEVLKAERETFYHEQ